MTRSEAEAQAIRESAYLCWCDAGRPLGEDLKFWLEAEREYDDQRSADREPDEIVAEASEESFPASDPPAWIPMTS